MFFQPPVLPSNLEAPSQPGFQQCSQTTETWHSHRHSSQHSCLQQEQCTRNSKPCFYSYQCPPYNHQHNMKSARRTTSNQLPIKSLHGPGPCFREQLKQSVRGRMDVICSWMTTRLWLFDFIFKIMCGTYIPFSKPFWDPLTFSGNYRLGNVGILRSSAHCMCLSGITHMCLKDRAEFLFLKMLLF